MSLERPAVVLCADLNGLSAVRCLALEKIPAFAVALSSSEPVLYSRFGKPSDRVKFTFLVRFACRSGRTCAFLPVPVI